MAMASPPLSTSTSVLCSRLKGTVCCSKLQMGGGGGVLRGWCGLKNLGVRGKGVQVKVKKGLWKGKVVYASLFGVGAPEALVIGVVALLVFGPKGLAEVARNLGKTLRAFQPTIRELQDVSREFKSTLTREIGLDDDISTPTPTPTPTNTFNSSDPNATRDPYTSEEYLKITQEQLKASAPPQTPPPKQGMKHETAAATDPETDKSPLDT